MKYLRHFIYQTRKQPATFTTKRQGLSNLQGCEPGSAMSLLFQMWRRQSFRPWLQESVGKRTKVTSRGQEVGQITNGMAHTTVNANHCTSTTNHEFGRTETTNQNVDVTPIQHQVCHLTPKQHGKLVKLVGSKCTIHCHMNGREVIALWDTGAQVSILSRRWWKENLSDVPLKSLKELIDTNLHLSAANDTKIPFDGWVPIDLDISLEGSTTKHIQVPFLVTDQDLPGPIVGYNVIEEAAKGSEQRDAGHLPPPVIRSAFTVLSSSTINTILAMVKANDAEDFSAVKVGKTDVIVPKGQLSFIACRIHAWSCNGTTDHSFHSR